MGSDCARVLVGMANGSDEKKRRGGRGRDGEQDDESTKGLLEMFLASVKEE